MGTIPKNSNKKQLTLLPNLMINTICVCVCTIYIYIYISYLVASYEDGWGKFRCGGKGRPSLEKSTLDIAFALLA